MCQHSCSGHCTLPCLPFTLNPEPLAVVCAHDSVLCVSMSCTCKATQSVNKKKRSVVVRVVVVLVQILDLYAGAMLLTDDFALVIVEGCRKSIKRYHKLLLRRIDWNARGDDLAVTAPGADEDDEGADVADKPPNSCYLVWEVRTRGVVGFRAA